MTFCSPGCSRCCTGSCFAAPQPLDLDDSACVDIKGMNPLDVLRYISELSSHFDVLATPAVETPDTIDYLAAHQSLATIITDIAAQAHLRVAIVIEAPADGARKASRGGCLPSPSSS